MDALVTGGAGFIGSNLVRRLAGSGRSVRVLDNLSTGSLDKLHGVDAEMLEGDIRDPEDVRRAAHGTEVIYHLAALPSVARSVRNPADSHDVNATGTLNVLMGAREAGVRRVVYASSSSVYGDTPTLPKHEDMPVAPRSPYAASKLAGEAYCRAFAASLEVETVSLRFFNVFGPRQDPASEYAAVIPRFITRMLEGEPPVVFGDGTQSRDFTPIDNVVGACLLAAGAGREASGEAMNIGCGERITLLELLEAVSELTGVRTEPIFEPPRPGDVHDSEASIAKARTLTGYHPLVDLRRGLAETVQWFATRRETTHAS